MTLFTSWVSENNSCFLPIKLPRIPEEEMFIPAGEIIWCRYGLLLASGDLFTEEVAFELSLEAEREY